MPKKDPRWDKIEVIGVNPVFWTPTDEKDKVDNFNLIYEVGNLDEALKNAPEDVRIWMEETRPLEQRVISLKEFKEAVEKDGKCIVMASNFFRMTDSLRGYVGIALDKEGKPTQEIKKAGQRYLIGTIKHFS